MNENYRIYNFFANCALFFFLATGLPATGVICIFIQASACRPNQTG
jgi:hypothetical protein